MHLHLHRGLRGLEVWPLFEVVGEEITTSSDDGFWEGGKVDGNGSSEDGTKDGDYVGVDIL